MEPTSTASIKTARWFFAGLLAVNLYRAMTQSVTPGEAWNYDRFIGPAWAEAFSRFDVNNHVLNTLLVRISTARFHLTELSLRLPSLIFGALYLGAVYRMARRWFGDGLWFLTVVGLLTLNPLVVDGLSEARGYGIALACWMWALDLILESLESFSYAKLNLSMICLGLSVAASLAFAAPACALLAVALLAWKGGMVEAAKPPAGRVVLVEIFFLTVFVLMVIPVNHAEWKTLGIGATSLRQTLNELTALSLGTSLKGWAAAGRVGVLLAALAGAALALRDWRRPEAALAGLTGATLPLTLLLLLAAHRWLHTPFPQQGVVYLIPLIVLPLAAGILKQNNRSQFNRSVQIVFLAASTALLVNYVAEFPFGMYTAGRQFAGGRTVAKALRERAGRSSIRIGASVAAEPVLNYYRTRYRQGNWQTVERGPLNGVYDYYVLTPADAAVIEQRHLHVLYRDAGLTLAQ